MIKTNNSSLSGEGWVNMVEGDPKLLIELMASKLERDKESPTPHDFIEGMRYVIELLDDTENLIMDSFNLLYKEISS